MPWMPQAEQSLWDDDRPALQFPETLPSLAAREEVQEPICTVVVPPRDVPSDGEPSLASPTGKSADTGCELGPPVRRTRPWGCASAPGVDAGGEISSEAQSHGPGVLLTEEDVVAVLSDLPPPSEGEAAQPRASHTCGPQQVADGPAMEQEVEHGCFRIRRVHVRELQYDGTLGLLLHGTSIVGFRTTKAREAGWAVSDQIVKVNARRVSTFDEFLESFAFAQAEGFPIIFSVLRREDSYCEPETEDALEKFFSTTDFANLAGELQRRCAGQPPPKAREEEAQQVPPQAPPPQAAIFTARSVIGGAGSIGDDNLANNPYVMALNRRREEQLQSNEGWISCSFEEADGSIPSRLATRQEGVAMLQGMGGQGGTAHAQHSGLSCACPFCIPDDHNAPGSACEVQTMVHELQPAPRAHFYEVPVLLDMQRVLGCDGADPLLGGQAPPESLQPR